MTARTLLSRFVGIVGLLAVFCMTSCNDLSENPPDAVTANNFFQKDQQFVSALGDAYSQLGGYAGSGGMMSMNEVTTDEMVVPQRGQDWYDGGTWARYHRHTWGYEDGGINGAWTFLYGGVNSCNRLIYQFNNLMDKGQVGKDKAQKFIAELKVLRAYYYYWLLDMFGNVPIVTKFAGAEKAPANNADFQTGRNQLFDFVESQIKDNIQKLDRAVDQSTYGRMNVWGAHFLLAKLYMNAKVYTGKPRWQDAVAQCDSVINSGSYSLATDFFASFKTENQNSPEIIFAIPYDKVYFTGNNWDMMTLHYANQKTFNLTAQPWNGFATLEDFYNSFQKDDQRKDGFLVGYQYDTKGNHLIDASAFKGEPHGDTLYFTPHINELEPRAWREGGARFNKFEYKIGSTANLSNDFPVFRYSDVLLMKAEALWRMNQSGGEALRLVNMIRERAGLADYNSLSGYKILMERGHELYTEMWRRQDLIRFSGGMHYKYNSDGSQSTQYSSGETAFNDAWWAKDVGDKHRNVFPIPRDQMQSNPNLNQIPGYK